MEITKAEFVISNSEYKKCPAPNMPEYAFIGRSNVGKSSLINMLTNQSKLAKVSGQPGKTQLINHFKINDAWYLVDLPGYGFAKASKGQREKWQKFITGYILNRENLFCLFVLVDSRLEPQQIDVDFMHWLGVNGVAFAIVFTKADKLSKNQLDRTVSIYTRELKKSWEELPSVFVTSAEKRMGKEGILAFIEDVNAKNPIQ
ncbi:MAG TPA: YihA family ribosome biogenesis GTP-binding protein [Marinilabiliales bacterium]|nr:YihA family ribosome biogenesis GTP-binding protein [Marinilabiliales bacterium]